MKNLSKVYLALVFIFLYAPIVVMILISFNAGESTAHMTGLSLRWYRQMLSDDITLGAFKNTVILSSLSAVITTVLGTLASVGISRIRRRRIRNAVKNVTNLPMVNPDIVTGISLMLLFVFTAQMLGRDSALGFGSLLIAHITFSLPYVIMSVLPKIDQLDRSVPEAAMDLGCTPAQSFFKVELPFIAPGIVTGLIMAFTLSFDDFVISNFTSGASFETLTIHIYAMIKKSVKPGIYALSTLIFIVVMALILVYNLLSSRDRRER